MGSPVDEGGWSIRQSSNALLGDEDRIAGGFGELLDAGCHIHGVTDKGELQLAAATDGSSDHHAGVDADADAQLPAEPLDDTVMNCNGGVQRGIGVIRKIVRCAEDSQRSVSEEFVDMATSVHNGRHDNLEQGVEARNGVLGGIRLGEWSEVADVDEHHGHLAALAGEHVVALLKQSRRQDRVDIGPEGRLKSLPLS
jgi:hypothetical protein